MKLLFLSIFALLVSVTAFSQAKAIEVIYTKAYKNFRDTSHTAAQPLKSLKYSLYCNPVASRFERISTVLSRSDEFIQFIYPGSGKGIYYKNTKDKKKLHQTRFMDSTFLIEENYNQYKWKLKNEKKEILGYECHKAVGSYEEYSYITKEAKTIRVAVWYAPGIPFAFGPVGYDGLPGLVLASYRGNFYFIATDIRFSDKEKKITLPDKGKSVTRKEFNNAIYEIYKKHTIRKKPQH